MQASKWDLGTTTDNDTGDVPRTKSPDDFADQRGTKIALLALCIAFFYRGYMVCEQPKF
jgi:hypothetical protein